MKFAVLVFPGSSEAECVRAVEECTGEPAQCVWHIEEDLSSFDGVIIPGGFSYGDYVRPGAIASHAPVMKAVKKEAERGALILGIGNGFQILLESGLLPGVLMRNTSLKFRSQWAEIVVENHRTPFTIDYEEKEAIRLPIAHGAGNYVCDEQTLASLKEQNRIVFRYAGENPNGSLDNIAGIVNEAGNVLGMMPHPERAVSKWLGSEDGKRLFTSILRTWREKHGVATTR